MRKFKIGDKIKCINKKGNPNSWLEIEKIYIVESTKQANEEDRRKGTRQWLWLNTKTGYWSDYQFELVENKIKFINTYGIVNFLEGLNEKI